MFSPRNLVAATSPMLSGSCSIAFVPTRAIRGLKTRYELLKIVASRRLVHMWRTADAGARCHAGRGDLVATDLVLLINDAHNLILYLFCTGRKCFPRPIENYYAYQHMLSFNVKNKKIQLDLEAKTWNCTCCYYTKIGLPIFASVIVSLMQILSVILRTNCKSCNLKTKILVCAYLKKG